MRIWLNDEEIFHGPGTNPGLPDKLHLYVNFKQGLNRLLVALHSNKGKAEGVRCLAEQDGRALV